MKLYATIDFYDEIYAAVWTPERLSAYFRMIRETGITRLYWIDQREIMDHCGQREVNERMTATNANFAGRLTETAVKLAHAAGLEIFALIKPYDLAPLCPALSPEAEDSPAIPVTGGICDRFVQFAADHPEAMLQRVPAPEHGPAKNLTLHFSGPLRAPAKVKLWTGTANKEYVAAMEQSATRGSREVNFELPAGKAFFALQIEDALCGNIYSQLVTVRDAAGRPVPVTLGIQPKKRYVPYTYHLNHQAEKCNDGGFRKMGMLFDYFPGIPSSIYPGDLAACTFFDFSEAEDHVLGVTTELNARIAGCPDPAHPAFQNFILDWVHSELVRGFDGIEIRVSNHNSPLFWSDYGSGPAVRRARGEAHTGLLRKIADRVRRTGKVMGIHIEDFMFGSAPETSSAMEFFWDYHRWIAEKLSDEVTAKIILTDGLTPGNFALVRECRAAGLRVNVCPFLHVVSSPLVYAAWSAYVGVDAFNIYETATVWQPKSENDGFREVNSAMLRQLRRISDIEVSTPC